MVNLLATADRRVRGTVVGGAVLAALPLLLHVRDAAPWVIGYFHLGYGTAFMIVTLILEGSPWLMWVFPWAIPEVATIQFLVAVFGISVCVGW